MALTTVRSTGISSLPSISGANLTSLTAGNLTGTLPAISGANLTGISAGKVVQTKMEGSFNFSGDVSSNTTTPAGFGNSLTITPTSSSSALLFILSVSDTYTNQNNALHINIKDTTNGTWVLGGSNRSFTTGLGGIGDGINMPMTVTGIIESAGSGARTYQGYFYSNANSQTVYVNNAGASGRATFCVMEITKDD